MDDDRIKAAERHRAEKMRDLIDRQDDESRDELLGFFLEEAWPARRCQCN